MIETFKHKGLRELFITNKTARLPAERVRKIKLILAVPHYWLSLQANYDLLQITRVNRRGISKVAVLA